MEKIRLQDTRFLNESGKEVIFQGVNVLHRGRENGHLYPDLEKAFPFFRESGFNLLRLGIFWDGAEPAPGKVDLDYLNRVKALVRTPRSSLTARRTGPAWMRVLFTLRNAICGMRPI